MIPLVSVISVYRIVHANVWVPYSTSPIVKSTCAVSAARKHNVYHTLCIFHEATRDRCGKTITETMYNLYLKYYNVTDTPLFYDDIVVQQIEFFDRERS